MISHVIATISLHEDPPKFFDMSGTSAYLVKEPGTYRIVLQKLNSAGESQCEQEYKVFTIPEGKE